MVTFAIYGALNTAYSVNGHATPGSSGATLGQQIVIDLISVILYLLIAALVGWLGGRPGAARGRALANRPDTRPEQPLQ
jgi:hypothetical protein